MNDKNEPDIERRPTVAFGKFKKAPLPPGGSEDARAIAAGERLGFAGSPSPEPAPKLFNGSLQDEQNTVDAASSFTPPTRLTSSGLLDGRTLKSKGRNCQMNIKCTEEVRKKMVLLSSDHGGPSNFLELLLGHWEKTAP